MPLAKASHDVSPGFADGTLQDIARRTFAPVVRGPFGCHRDHDSIDALEPAGGLLFGPGQELFPGHGGVGLVGLGECHGGTSGSVVAVVIEAGGGSTGPRPAPGSLRDGG